MSRTRSEAEITRLARREFEASLARGLDVGCAEDNARDVVREHATRPGFFDAETLTWTSEVQS